jgi:putative phosphoserine phosphatase/1-acylglycerol-3-phosphate O-acyltransferase
MEIIIFQGLRFSMNDLPKFDYLACFDLDRTILSINSAEILIREAYREGLMKSKDLLSAYFLAFLYKLRPGEAVRIMERMTKWMEGITEESINRLSGKIVTGNLISTIRPEIYTELSFHKNKMAGTIILSSSLFPVCSPIADHLGMNDIICSGFEVKNGLFTGHTSGGFCFGEEKLIRLKDYCSKNDHRISESYYYADSFWDYPVLNEVGHPVCINPDKKLRKAAENKGWVIHDWH